MRVEVVTRLEDFLALESEWDTLVREVGASALFCSHAWFRCWWQAYARSEGLWLVTARDGQRLVAVAPLMRARVSLHGLRSDATCFIENGVTPFSQVIVGGPGDGALDGIVSCVSAETIAPLILLRNLPADGGDVDRLELALRRHGWRTGRQPGLRSPYLDIGMEGPWRPFLARRSLRFRKGIRNKINRLKRLGQFTVQEICTWAEFQASYQELMQIARGSWKARLSASLCDGGNREFYRLLAHCAGPRGQLSVWLGRIDGRPVAYEFHLKDNGVHHALKAEFDEAFRDVSPGSVLDYEIVKALFERGCTAYHQGGDADFYKLRWSKSCSTHSHLFGFRRGIRGAFLWAHEFATVPGLKRTGAILSACRRRARHSKKREG